VKAMWARFWMRHAGLGPLGRVATRLASLFSPPYKARAHLAHLSVKGYIAPSASIYHDGLELKEHVFVGDRVVVFGGQGGGRVSIGRGVHIHCDCIFETGFGGSVTIGDGTSVQPRCVFSAYLGSITIGSSAQIAPNCAFYPYDHGVAPGELIKNQPLRTKGGIVIGDDVWLGFGVIVVDGGRVGDGAVIGAGSIVTRDIPQDAIAVGAPARVLRSRER
jgi:acetyltransferase-like isoleucine patch superfamily enzyme